MSEVTVIGLGPMGIALAQALLGNGHSGAESGDNSYFVDPQKKLTVICLTNTAVARMVGEFSTALVNAVYGNN